MTQRAGSTYLLAGQASELDRLQLQSRVWEPAGRAFVQGLEYPDGTRADGAPPEAVRALDAGCGVRGWLRVLSEWVGPRGRVTGIDFDDKMLANAQMFVESEKLGNVELVRDDLFASTLPDASFDLVHARFQIAPLGRADEQLAFLRRVVKPGGWIVLEDPDIASWRINPAAAAASRLIDLIRQGFVVAGGNFNFGRELPKYLSRYGEPRLSAQVIALPPGHPYLRLPVQFATALKARLEALVGARQLTELLAQVEDELARPETWGTTFTLIQAAARVER